MPNSEDKLKVAAFYSQVDSISSIDAVSWIEEVPKYFVYNDVASVIISANSSWDYYGLSGFNQTVAISDSGLDTGSDNNISADFKGKVIFFNWYGSSPDDNNGHGTHTTGSIAGSGNNSQGQFKGMAYNANIVFQALGDNTGSNSVYPPDNLSDLFIQAYDNGSRVHSNSWGSPSNPGDYSADSQTVDDFSWNYTDFLVVFSAGNQGSGLNTVAFPSTSKNCLSIGASENDRPDKGGSSDNIDEVASFSSRGPTDDGRIKPDLVAPGTSIVSVKSSVGSNSCSSLFSSNGNYSYCSGTSMAAPITAGAAVLVREYYSTLGINPSSALVKASLINGAMDIGYGIPSNETGWGRINLSESTHPPRPKVLNYTDYSPGLSTSESASFYYTVYNDSVPLKVTLVWTDYPADLSAEKTLVNDLNLVVASPDGSVFNGNDNEVPFNDLSDNKNNVEQVSISNLSLGSYIVNVSAFNIPNGPQPFALVVSGPIAPFVYLLTENNSAFVSSNVILNFSVDDSYNSSNCSLFLNGVLNDIKVNVSAYSSFELNLSRGSHNWSVSCDDGLFISESDVFFFVIDLSPTIMISSPENITYSSALLDLNFSVSNPDSCWYSIGSGNVSLNSCSNTTLAVNESSYLLYLFANYSDGSENFSSVAFRSDVTPPVISLVSPSDGSVSSSSAVNFVFNVSDSEVDNCSLFVDEAVVLTNSSYVGEQSFVYTLSNGNYNWSVSCSDMAANTNSSQTYSLTVSYNPPVSDSPSQPSSSGGGGGGGGGGGSSSKNVVSCEESWTCSAWSDCVGNSQKRFCTDMNGCGTASKKPLTSMVCASPYVLFENGTEVPERKAEADVEKPESIQKSEIVPPYKVNLYFYGPFIAVALFFVYVFCRLVLNRKFKNKRAVVCPPHTLFHRFPWERNVTRERCHVHDDDINQSFHNVHCSILDCPHRK